MFVEAFNKQTYTSAKLEVEARCSVDCVPSHNYHQSTVAKTWIEHRLSTTVHEHLPFRLLLQLI